jgi:hypothetical protein
MREQLEQMLELSKALQTAADAGDVDRVVTLLKRRKDLTEHMGHPDPGDPEVASGKVAQLLQEIVAIDGEVEGKIRALMGTLQKAIQAVQGEKDIVQHYLKQADSSEPKFIDKEG